MQFDNIYMYKVFYIDEQGFRKSINTYSDNADIYSLQNLPDTTYYIEQFYFANKDGGTPFSKSYIVGTPLGVEELEKEIKVATDKHYRDELLTWNQSITQLNTPYTILRIQGKILCLYKYDYKGELAGEIQCGRIMKEKPAINADNDNYISLE